ncbi:hypothetical protein [Pseudokineococcus lusitanus]|uniref:hypothetical protein n=1 Tax=Pseudokineococcus lusitanus TaxID=763993 RepID=UPI000F49693B|nr:hypothetical protein [Pseudokineococcus lusitanus]
MLTHAPIVTTDQPPAGWHVLRCAQIEHTRASKIKAAEDPEGDYRRLLAYVYAKTPETILRPGAMTQHCGIDETRARQVLSELMDDGLIAPGATTRLSLTGRQVARGSE